MSRYLLIGSGVAAIAAAETLRERDANSEILLLSEDQHGYYSRPGLAYLLTGELDETQLFPFQKKDFQRLDAAILHESAAQILPPEHQVITHTGRRLSYDRLLIAVGARANLLSLPGSQAGNAFKLDDLDDTKRLLKAARRGRTAVVTGGGITGLELAEGLLHRGMKVHFVFRDTRYWPSVLDEAESEIVQNQLMRMGIQLHYPDEIAEILLRGNQAVGVRLASGGTIACDLFAYAIGIRPRTELAAAAGVTCERGILVDEGMRTNQADIFAAGDCAAVYDPVQKRYQLDSLWNPAREQGKTAALSMLGLPAVYNKPSALNVTRLGGVTTTIIGEVRRTSGPANQMVRGESDTWQIVPDAVVAEIGCEVDRIRLMVGKRAILGALVMGDQRYSPIFQRLIEQRVDISPIRPQLLALDAQVLKILAGYQPPD